jgi:hypothetical protein
MKARALGRFVAELLEGFAGESDAPAVEATAAPAAPIVVPVEMVREAVAAFLQPLMDAEEQQAPSGQQLDMIFADAAPPPDDIADMTLRRVAEMRAREEHREAMERAGSAVPPVFDANTPGEKPWMGAQVARETVERSTA